jgi:hypothetical protein
MRVMQRSSRPGSVPQKCGCRDLHLVIPDQTWRDLPRSPLREGREIYARSESGDVVLDREVILRSWLRQNHDQHMIYVETYADREMVDHYILAGVGRGGFGMKVDTWFVTVNAIVIWKTK